MLRGILAAAALMFAGQAAAQDVTSGEKAFVVCRACHQIGVTAKDAVGPVLNGVVGRAAGTEAGYNYSPAMKNSGLKWNDQTLQAYLANPQAVVKGTKMIFAGLKDPAKVDDVIAFLKTYNADGSRTQ